VREQVLFSNSAKLYDVPQPDRPWAGAESKDAD